MVLPEGSIYNMFHQSKERTMELADLKKQYDIMQMEFGAPGLRSVYYGGCDVDPDICFVFMNPTVKNVAAEPSWTGIRSPGSEQNISGTYFETSFRRSCLSTD